MNKKLVAAAALATSAVVGGSTLALPMVTASAANGSGTVATRVGMPLSVNPAPRLNAKRVGWVRSGERITISCQVVGDAVKGPWGTNNLWDYIPGKGYVADAWVNTGSNKRLAGVPDCGAKPGTTTPGKPVTNQPGTPAFVAKGKLIGIHQGSGQPTQWSDCGPTSVVAVVLYTGRTPRAWDPKAPAAAITQARRDAGGSFNGRGTAIYTHGYHLERALDSYPGIESHDTRDWNELIAAAKAGKPVIMGGNSGYPNWRKDKVNQRAYGGHWFVVAGYDAKTDTFRIMDPISARGTDAIHTMKSHELKTFHDQNASLGGVIVDRA